MNTTILGDGQNNGKNDIQLNSVFFNSNEIYNTFVGPDKVTRLGTGSSSVNNGLRVIAAKNGSVSDKVSVLSNGNGISGEEVSNSVFRNKVAEAFQSNNLNWFFDSYVSDPHFCMDTSFATNPLTNKVFVTERGPGGGNSRLTLQALDKNGKLIGNKVNIDPRNGKNLGLNGAVYSQGTSPKALDIHQEISMYAFDVKDFGVSEIFGLRVTTPHVNLLHGQDIQPDFKVFGSAAPVPEPGTMLAIGAGAAFLASRRRKKSTS